MDERLFHATNVSSAVRLYCFWFLAIFLTSMLTIGFVSIPQIQPKLSGAAPLPWRVQHYLQDPHAYSVIFLGDSRTYCGIHPELIERYVNTMHGLNLSSFAHWLPTQWSGTLSSLFPMIRLWSGRSDISTSSWTVRHPILCSPSILFRLPMRSK